MSPSAQHTTQLLKEIIEDEENTEQGARENQEHFDDSDEVLNQDNSISVLWTILNNIYNEFEHKYHHEAVRLLNTHPIHQSEVDHVRGHKYSIPGLLWTKFLAHQVWAFWVIVRRWDLDSDMPGALVADEMGLCMTFTSVAAIMTTNLSTEKVVMGCHYQFGGGVPITNGSILLRWTIPALWMRNGSAIHCADSIHCPTAFWCSWQLHLPGIQWLHQCLNQSLWSHCPNRQRHSRVSLTRWPMGLITSY